MNRKEKLVLFKTLKDLMVANRESIPVRFGSIGDIDRIISELERKK